MAKRTRPWRPDFAGRHGTAWGAINLCLTAVTITSVEHVVFVAPMWWALILTGAGVLGTLMRATFRKKETPPATIAYQLACWTGIGVWAAWMLTQSAWTLESFGTGIIVLIAATVSAGILAALGSEDKPQNALLKEIDVDAQSQRARNALGASYVERIHRLAGHRKGDMPLIDIEGIQQWKQGGGHTVEGTFTSGSWGISELERIAPRLASDMGLDTGCGIEVYGGMNRKVWFMDVTTQDALSTGCPFPVDTAGPYSINGGIPIGVRPNGQARCVNLRQRNLAIEGMPGSGKTGGLQATVGSLALTADAITLGFDATGADLIQPFQAAFLDGRARRPVFSHYADSYDECAQILRAMLRISYARKMAYGYLKAQHGTALIPMGAVVRAEDLSPGARKFYPECAERLVPQIMWIGDETTGLLRARNPEHQEATDLIAKCMQETRGSGIRFIIPPLGGDDQYVGQKFQKLVHTVAALKMDSIAEYKHALGSGYTVDAADISAVGTGLWRDEPGASLERFRFYGEMTQDVIDRIAIRADQLGTLPDLDFISELAANGIRPDGTAWPVGIEMKSEDTGWWDKRWEKLTAGVSRPVVSTPVVRKESQARGGTVTMDDLRIKIQRVNEDVAARIAEVKSQESEDLSFDWSTIPDWLPEIPSPRNWRDVVMDAITQAGPRGAQMKCLVEQAGVHRDTVHEFLAEKCEAGEVMKPRTGWYALPGDEAVAA